MSPVDIRSFLVNALAEYSVVVNVCVREGYVVSAYVYVRLLTQTARTLQILDGVA